MRKPTLFHKYTFWIPMPFMAFTLMYIFYGDRVWNEWQVWAVTFPILYFIGYFSWFLHTQYDFYLHDRLPSLDQTGKRIVLHFGVNVFIMTPSILLILALFNGFNILGYSIGENDIKYSLLMGLCVNLIFGTLWEVIYIIDKYKESASEIDVLEQLQLQQEFDGLKQKVNPHFLFNCFNTLSSLITEDKDKAENFLDEMSKVYRYLLRNNEDGMSTLENEIKFIKSYIELLKTRYSDAVNFQLEVDRQYYNYLLPSLSLQMLVENAVKHNSLSRTKPLTIEIFTTAGNKLVVNNNLQRKNINGQSNKIGLQNIRSKYDLIKLPGFQVIEEGNNYTVVLPLLWNNKAEQTRTIVGKTFE